MKYLFKWVYVNRRPLAKISGPNPISTINQYDALIGDGRAGEEVPSFEGGVHVRTCRCTPHLTCVSLSSNGSLETHQV